MKKNFGWNFWKIFIDILVASYFVSSNFESLFNNIKGDKMTKVYVTSVVIVLFSYYLVNSIKNMLVYLKNISNNTKNEKLNFDTKFEINT